MSVRSRFGAIAATALVALLVGLGVGFVIGSVVMRNTVWDLSRPAFISSGNQAHTVLFLLRSGQTDRLQAFVEDEIDSTLLYLRSIKPQLSTDSPEWKVYERLSSYRASHPRMTTAAPTTRR